MRREVRTGKARHLRKALVAIDAFVVTVRGHEPGPRDVALHGAGLGLRAGHDDVDFFSGSINERWGCGRR
jgi:hypothetical protein